MNGLNLTIKQIEVWPKDENDWHVSPEGLHIKLGRRATIGRNNLFGNYSRVGNGARVGNGIHFTKTITSILGSRGYTMGWCSPTEIHIGCTVMTPDDWRAEHENLASERDFSSDQIEEYRRYFDLLMVTGPDGLLKLTDEEIAKSKAEHEEWKKAMRAEAEARRKTPI